jgi:hypothetical protein
VPQDCSGQGPDASGVKQGLLYLFDLEAWQNTVRDAKGRHFASLDAAKAEGLRQAREVIANGVRGGELHLRGVITIRNEGARYRRPDLACGGGPDPDRLKDREPRPL